EKLHRPDDQRRIYEAMRREDDLKEQGLEGLIACAGKRKDLAAVVALEMELVALKGGDEKKQVWRRVAETRAEQRKWPEAEEAFRKALDLGTADGWSALGEWLGEKEQHERSLAAWTKALELDPHREQALYPFARAAWRNKDFGVAFARCV